MRLLATGLILILAGVLAAQDAPKKKKKVRPPFKWVNKLSANAPKEVRHATFRSPLMGVEVGCCIYLPAQCEAAKTKRFPVVALVGCREAEQEAAPIQQAHAEDVHTYEDSKEAHAATEAKSAPVNIADPIVEKVIRAQLKKLTGELTQGDLEKVPGLSLESHQLIDVKDLEKLTQLEWLSL